MHVHVDTIFESSASGLGLKAHTRQDEADPSIDELEGDLDLLSLYLSEAGRYPLLSRAEEQDAARAMGAAERKLRRRLSKRKQLDTRREYACARGRLINCSLRLVISIAKRYQKLGMDFLDLVQEGNIGLMHAVERFDPRRGTKLSTYATWWIRQAITRALSKKARTVRVPINKLVLQRRVLHEWFILKQRHGREPTFCEVSEKIGESASRVKEAIRSVPQVQSLDAEVVESGSFRWELLPDGRSPSQWKKVLNQELQDELSAAINLLPVRQQLIVRMHFGIGMPTDSLLKDIGRVLDISRERVRQLEVEALHRLRAIAGETHLRDFLTD